MTAALLITVSVLLILSASSMPAISCLTMLVTVNANHSAIELRRFHADNATVSSPVGTIALPNSSWSVGPVLYKPPFTIMLTTLDTPDQGGRTPAWFSNYNLSSQSLSARYSSVPAYMRHLFVESVQDMVYSVNYRVLASTDAKLTVTQNAPFFPYDVYTEIDQWTNSSLKRDIYAAAYDDQRKRVMLAVQSEPPMLSTADIFTHEQVSSVAYPTLPNTWVLSAHYSSASGVLFTAIAVQTTPVAMSRLLLIQAVNPITSQAKNITVFNSTFFVNASSLIGSFNEGKQEWLLVSNSDSALHMYVSVNVAQGRIVKAGYFDLDAGTERGGLSLVAAVDLCCDDTSK